MCSLPSSPPPGTRVMGTEASLSTRRPSLSDRMSSRSRVFCWFTILNFFWAPDHQHKMMDTMKAAIKMGNLHAAGGRKGGGWNQGREEGGGIAISHGC